MQTLVRKCLRSNGLLLFNNSLLDYFQSTAQIITKIAPPTGQSAEQFSYTICVVFYKVFVVANARKDKFGALVGCFGKALVPSHTRMPLRLHHKIFISMGVVSTRAPFGSSRVGFG